MKEYLDSNRLNFLVWRFLIESNYRETAVKFQKEWHVPEPHRHFEFAQHVESHALVRLVSLGLHYQELQREFVRRQLPQDAADAAQEGVFGPLLTQPPPKEELEEPEDENLRKRQSDSRPSANANGASPAKRPRLSNGYHEPDSAMTGVAATTPMDLDHAAESNHAYPSPLEGEQAPTPLARTEGGEQATQVDKVEELAPKTTFLRLLADDGAPDSVSPSPASYENAPILLHCEWNPQDPSILAAAGTDALARVWTISRATATANANATAPEPSHVNGNGLNRPYHDLVDEDMPRTAPVTAMSWSNSGHAIAVAVEHGSKARINVWSQKGVRLDSFEGAEHPIYRLRWNPSNAALLAIAPDKNAAIENGDVATESRGAVVSVHRFFSTNTLTYPMPRHDLNNWPLDAVWTNDSDFLLCGGDVLLHLRCTETTIVTVKKFETRPDDAFTQVLFDSISQLAATAGDKGMLDLWDETGQRRSISAHSGAITAMQWQPLQSPPLDDERLIATGGDDCAILVWNARIPEKTFKYYFTMEAPIVALAFTPDGAFIAGATAGHILIWKVGESTVPHASWSRTPHPGWLSPKASSESDEEDEHRLCWDPSGQKLAYGFNSRLAVINFR